MTNRTKAYRARLAAYRAAFEAMAPPRTAEALAKALGIHKQTVMKHSRATRLRLEGNKRKVTLKAIRKAYREACTLREMGELLSLSPEGARKACLRVDGLTKFQRRGPAT